MPASDSTSLACDLTALGLWLLEVPFESASPSSGELFDDLLAAAGDHLVHLATAVVGGGPAPPRPVLDLSVDAVRRRREQQDLRRTVAAGRYPACTSTLREAEVRCAQAVTDLTHLRHRMPPALVGELGATTSMLAACARTCASYRRHAVRFQRESAAGDGPRLAVFAARAERELVRRLTHIAAVTYGRPDSGDC